jgi:hypothetical protein
MTEVALFEATDRALMKLIQGEHFCEMTGAPCRDPAACQCFREKIDHVANEEEMSDRLPGGGQLVITGVPSLQSLSAGLTLEEFRNAVIGLLWQSLHEGKPATLDELRDALIGLLRQAIDG